MQLGIMPGEGFKLESVYRSKSRLVAWVDLIFSLLCITISVGLLLFALKTRTGSELVIGYRQDLVWFGRTLVEIVCITLAIMLNHSTSPYPTHRITEEAVKWCMFWLFNCGIWVICQVIAVILISLPPDKSEFIIAAIVVLSVIIVVRVGAIFIVINYLKELKSDTQMQLRSLTAD